jgi:iron complex outermembrane receptor protein
MQELYTPQAVGTSANFKDPKTGVANQFNVLGGGNTNLKPENSEQASIGMVLQPIKNLTFSVDYWKIRISDLITTIDPQFIVDQAFAGNSTYTGLVQRDAAGNITQITSTNLNAGGVSTSGIDLDVRWLIAKTANYGTYGAHLNGTYLTKFDEKLPDGSIQPSIGATIMPGTGTVLNAVSAGGILNRWKHVLTFDWRYGPYAVALTQNFQSGYWDNARADSATGTDAQHVGSFSTWDIQGSYTGVKNLTLRAGLKNMFNRLPPDVITLNQYFQTGYDPTYYDPHGMFGYLNATYKF